MHGVYGVLHTLVQRHADAVGALITAPTARATTWILALLGANGRADGRFVASDVISVEITPKGALCAWVGWTVKIHGQLLGGAQWALLTWVHWLRILGPAAPKRGRVRAARGRRARRRARAPIRRAHAG